MLELGIEYSWGGVKAGIQQVLAEVLHGCKCSYGSVLRSQVSVRQDGLE